MLFFQYPITSLICNNLFQHTKNSDYDQRNSVLILYGSQGRTAEFAAKLFYAKLKQISNFINIYLTSIPNLKNLDENLKFNSNNAFSDSQFTINLNNFLNNYSYIAIFISTWLQGSFPEGAEILQEFFENLNSNENIFSDLKGVSILGFGDSQYENFCLPAKYLFKKFQNHGAYMLHKPLLLDSSDKSVTVEKCLNFLFKMYFTRAVYEDESDYENDDIDLECNSEGSDFEDVTNVEKKMLSSTQYDQLVKEGYKIVGTHSAVKLCRWTKSQLRGRGGCYKHSFYGIASYLCMEATPSLACANKCVFCWRHHKNPVGKSWKWKTDDPEMILNEFIANHQKMINTLKGVPGVNPERFEEAVKTPKHCALSLVGEPIMYPLLNKLLSLMHEKHISTFLVTNAQFPEEMKKLSRVTQLYMSVDAATPETLKAIDQPLNEDYWERFQQCLSILHDYPTRTVFRLTLVNTYNMQQAKEFGELILKALPDFIEIKAVTFSGVSNNIKKITMKDIPWHDEVIDYAKAIVSSNTRLSEIYDIGCEHKHSCCVLIASKKFFINNRWHTWINYKKFFQLVESGKPFTSLDYCAETPYWAVYNSVERGFDPLEERVYTKGKNKRLMAAK